jgi:hypothetical protein
MFNYYKPKTTEVTKQVHIMKRTRREIMTVITDTAMDKKLTIPVRANFHPAALYELSKYNKGKVLEVAMFMLTKLDSKEQDGVIDISLELLGSELSLSKPTLIAALRYLEENSYLTRVSKQEYRITAKLGWFGNQVDWACELLELKIAGVLSPLYFTKAERKIADKLAMSYMEVVSMACSSSEDFEEDLVKFEEN